MTSARIALRDVIAGLREMSSWRGVLSHVVLAKSAWLLRTAGPQSLFTLPSGCTVLAINLFGEAGSNAGSAGIRIGVATAPAYFVPLTNVVGAAGTGQMLAAVKNLGPIPDDGSVEILGEYLESGTPSTTGGRWGVLFLITRD